MATWGPQKGRLGLKKGAIPGRGEHFPEYAKNHWGKVSQFFKIWEFESLMKFNSASVFGIWDVEVLTIWRETFLNVKRKSTQLKGIVSQ